MTTSLGLFVFGAVIIAAIVKMMKIQRAELAEAREKRNEADDSERKREARLEEYRAKCYQRVDGD